MQLIKDKIKKIIGILPPKIEKYIYDSYHYIRFFPRLCIFKIQFRILPLIKKDKKKDFVKKKKYTVNHQIHKQKRNLVFKDIKKAQSLIDSLSYPSTHQYKVDKLEAFGDLKRRLDIFNLIVPNFFEGQHFLDVGCNKGFFSLLAAQSFEKVQSIDMDKKFVELCNELKQPNMEVFNDSFRDFMPEIQFDKIFIGNVHHYIFKECRGWEWVCKLAAISTGEVLIEGPVDMSCQDIKNLFSRELQSKFTFEDFIQAMDPFFSLEKKIKSCSQGRWVMLFKRKKDGSDNKVELFELPILKIFQDTKSSLVYLTKTKHTRIVAKIKKIPKKNLKILINIARFSPVSNNIIGSIYKDEEFIGWLEKYEDKSSYSIFEENREIQVKLFKLLCDHTIFLAKLGYFDKDSGTCNFFKKNNRLFDKGGVIHIEELNESVYGNSFSKRYQQGEYFIQMKPCYDIISQDIQKDIYQALKSKDPYTIETTFAKIKNLLC